MEMFTFKLANINQQNYKNYMFNQPFILDRDNNVKNLDGSDVLIEHNTQKSSFKRT